MRKIFVLDDEKDFLLSIKNWGEKKGYDIKVFENSDGFVDAVKKFEPEVILIDIKLPNEDGRLVAKQLKQTLEYPVHIILISSDPAALIVYEHFSADGILNKPFSFFDLELKLKQHLDW